MALNIPDELNRVLTRTPELNQAYLVGGSVRDALLDIPVKDFDIEVFGLSLERLAKVLAPWGRTDLVGRSFGVIKLTLPSGNIIDFSIPRRDSKTGLGHKGFEITFDPGITPREAASRRDYTLNALMFDPRRREILDHFGGQADLQNRILRHTSDAFAEDPLRVLRGMQLAARFQLTAAPETAALCREIKNTYHELAVERVREEWFKWASRSALPSAGLKFLDATGWLEHFPELKALQGVPQDPEWHPEGDAYIHTCHCCDAMAKLPEWQQADEETRIVLSLAILTHDFGKPATTQTALRDGATRIISPGHEESGIPIAENFLNRLRTPLAIIERVLPLIRYHMSHLITVTDRSARRLAKRLEPETIFDLCVLMTADSLGRPPRPPQIPKVIPELEAKARELQIHDRAPKPILMGRHLLELGMTPGPQIGQIVNDAYEAQLEGKFFDLPQALKWLEEHKKTDFLSNDKKSNTNASGK
jgi:tRNA nucleotidyltransferase (CCA-adding enzyme)